MSLLSLSMSLLSLLSLLTLVTWIVGHSQLVAHESADQPPPASNAEVCVRFGPTGLGILLASRRHPGDAHCWMSDGAVAFITESIDAGDSINGTHSPGRHRQSRGARRAPTVSGLSSGPRPVERRSSGSREAGASEQMTARTTALPRPSSFRTPAGTVVAHPKRSRIAGDVCSPLRRTPPFEALRVVG